MAQKGKNTSWIQTVWPVCFTRRKIKKVESQPDVTNANIDVAVVLTKEVYFWLVPPKLLKKAICKNWTVICDFPWRSRHITAIITGTIPITIQYWIFCKIGSDAPNCKIFRILLDYNESLHQSSEGGSRSPPPF